VTVLPKNEVDGHDQKHGHDFHERHAGHPHPLQATRPRRGAADDDFEGRDDGD